MNREDIIKLAREAGIDWSGQSAEDVLVRAMHIAYTAGAAAERKSKSHSLAPGQMELSLQREHNGELFEYRYRFTHLQVMNKAEFFVKEIARKLDVEMDRAIQARGNT